MWGKQALPYKKIHKKFPQNTLKSSFCGKILNFSKITVNRFVQNLKSKFLTLIVKTLLQFFHQYNYVLYQTNHIYHCLYHKNPLYLNRKATAQKVISNNYQRLLVCVVIKNTVLSTVMTYFFNLSNFLYHNSGPVLDRR